MSETPHRDAALLRGDIAALTRRVYALEQQVEQLTGQSVTQPIEQPQRPFAPAPVQPIEAPVAAAAAVSPYAQPERPHVPPAPAPPREPFNWGELAEKLFTARTLAWAGGVATALGLVLLYVMASNRGWVTAPMRVSLGVGVSLVILAAAIEFDRRSWRADAILAAAGVGIAGLYASLWASASLYHFISAAPASALAALIAALAVAVAIYIEQEPLAVFGVSAAMLAPVLVSQDVTAYGVLYASLMLATTIPLFLRYRWQWLAMAAWLVGVCEAAALIVVSSDRDHTGFGAPVVAIAVTASLIVCLLFLVELLPRIRNRISPFGWLLASSSFTLALGGVFLYAGQRDASGHSLAGLAMAGLAVVWAACAAVPYLARRRHDDLTDVLVAFSLTMVAAATGLLVGGAALACTWAAQSAMLVVAAERISGRSRQRQRRIVVAAGVYLTLATASTIAVAAPSNAHLPHIGAGGTAGAVALVALTLAGVAYCYATRWVALQWRIGLWALPAAALGYLPLWSLPAEWAVCALSALTAGLLVYRRSSLMVTWLNDVAAIAITAAWWLAAAMAALIVAAPLDRLAATEWTGVGSRDGLAALSALTAAAAVSVWSLRRSRLEGVEYLLWLPVATFAYLLAELLTAPYVMWAWLALAAALAGAVHAPLARRALGEWPLISAGAAAFTLGLVSAWNYDQSLNAVTTHGISAGWPSILIAVAAGTVLATALRDPRRRSYALALPYLLIAQLSTMLLHGQYPLVAFGALAVAASAAAITWAAPLRERLDRRAMAEIGVAGSLGVALLVVFAYETPRMLFVSSHTPASGLAAALSATVALFVAVIAAKTQPEWVVGRLRAGSGLLYLAGAAALWTLAAAILGGGQWFTDPSNTSSVHDGFQQGHVAVSISWVLVGLMLVVASLRGDRRGLRVGGIALLFAALGKLFLYDLAFLTAMARAISFIATGSVLLLAALLLQRFAPQVKAAFTDEHPAHS